MSAARKRSRRMLYTRGRRHRRVAYPPSRQALRRTGRWASPRRAAHPTHPTHATHATHRTHQTYPAHPAMKIAVIGGAGVRTPLLVGGLSRSDLPIEEIALYDL